ncbi:MAG: DMT family transporter [Chitinophagaceae bacterium]|nr:DMT family transporter [Chitinophagaceae bacterium]
MKKFPSWLVLTLFTMVMNGIWGALIEIPEKRMSPPFPTSLGYIVWSLTFIPCSLYILYRAGWKLDVAPMDICKGMLVGLLGAGGQFVLFEALRAGPAYIIFPITSVYPLVTIVLSIIFLREKAGRWASAGIVLAFISIFLLSLQEPDNSLVNGYTWLWLSIAGFFMWGFQAFFAKIFLEKMSAESIFFYITVGNLFFIPLAWKMTDFSRPVSFGGALGASVLIQFLNALAAVFMVFALRKGKVIIISPVSALAPMITTVLSLIIYSRMPYVYHAYGIIVAMMALAFITYGEVVNSRLNNKPVLPNITPNNFK